MKNKQNLGWFLPFILACCYVVGLGATESFITALPLVSKDLRIPMDLLSSSLGINFICAGLGCFFSGFILNAFSKKHFQIFILLLFALGCVLCFFSSNMEMLLLGRIFQGLSSGISQVLGLAILKEVYRHRDFMRSVSRVSLFIESIALTAPFVGSFITSLTNWRLPFLVFMLISLGLCISVYKEFPAHSLKIEKSVGTSYQPFLQRISKFLKIPGFMVWVFIGAFANGGFWGFISIAPYYFQNVQKVSLVTYGFFQTLFTASYAVGAFVVEHQSKKQKDLIITIIFITVGAFITFLIGEGFFQGVCVVMGGIIFGIANGILYPVVTGIILSQVEERSVGLATSFYGLCRFFCAALCMLGFSEIYALFPNSFNRIILCFIGMVILSQIYGRKKHPKDLYTVPKDQESFM